MQIMVLILFFVALLAFIIYKINNRFGTKEFIIFSVVIIVSVLVAVMVFRNEKQKVPELFKQKYEKQHNVTISKFSYERVNNKNISSKIDFIYDFNYIILKDGKEIVCKAKDVKIKKIEDEYIFENFNNLKEECQEN